MPCSNVGHIYREFDRFGVDPQLKVSVAPTSPLAFLLASCRRTAPHCSF